MDRRTEYRELRVRPLSEGIGLGSLKSATGKYNPMRSDSHGDVGKGSSNSRAAASNQSAEARSSAAAAVATDADFDIPVMRQAHAAYAPHSVATDIRGRSSVKLYVAITRFLAGVGTDIFVGAITALVLAWAGVLAWNAGASGDFNITEALITVAGFISGVTLPQALIAAVVLAVTWRLIRIIFSRL